MSTTVLKQMAGEFSKMSKNVNKIVAKHLAIRKKQKEKEKLAKLAKRSSPKKGRGA